MKCYSTGIRLDRQPKLGQKGGEKELGGLIVWNPEKCYHAGMEAGAPFSAALSRR